MIYLRKMNKSTLRHIRKLINNDTITIEVLNLLSGMALGGQKEFFQASQDYIREIEKR